MLGAEDFVCSAPFYFPYFLLKALLPATPQLLFTTPSMVQTFSVHAK